MYFRFSSKLILLLVLVWGSLTCDATHLLGGYMNYEFININTTTGEYRYKITFHVYRDCSGNVQLDDKITLGVYLNDNNKSLNQQPVFNLVTKKKVNPPGSIDCDFYEKNVCIEYGLYEGIVSLKPYSEGYHITYTRCCRNVQNNIIQDGSTPSQGQTYYCFIPATALENSSPSFYGVPSPYMCVNDTNSFLFDAVDKDGDSLVYRFMRPYQGGSSASSNPAPAASLDTPLLRYKAGYTSITPFGANGYTFIDKETGYTELFSNQTGNFVVGVEVLEYRNGQLLGKIRMDLQIMVLNCIANTIPDITSSKGQRFTIEAGEELCFYVRGQDPDDDQVTVSARGSILNTIPGTKATFSGPLLDFDLYTYEFCWTPDCDAAQDQPYNVYFTAEDDGCPPKFNYLDVSIKVLPFEGASQLIGPTLVCKYSTHSYEVIDGHANSTYEWEVFDGKFIGDSTIKKVNVYWKGSDSGGMTPFIRVREVSANGCLGDWIRLDITIQESPEIPVIIGKDTVCKEDIGLVYSVNDNPGNSYYWETLNASIGIQNKNSIELSSFSIPNFKIRVAETNSIGCTSDTAQIEVYVIEPNPTITGPTIVCPNALDIVYTVSGVNGSVYNWTIVGGSQSSGGNSNTISVDWGDEGSGQVSVTEINKFGCLSNLITLNVAKSYTLGNNSLQAPSEVCEMENGSIYQVDSVHGSVYDWTIIGGKQQSGDSSSLISIDWGIAGSANVRVVQRAYDAKNDRWCVSPPSERLIVIFPTPKADQISGSMKWCQSDDSVTYVLNGESTSTYLWNIDGNTDPIVGQGTSTITIFWNQPGVFKLSVIETSEKGCSGILVDTLVTIHPKPSTSPLTGPTTICPKSTLNHMYSVTGYINSEFNWTVNGALNYTGDPTPTVIVDWDLSQPEGNLAVVEVSDQGCAGDTQRLTVNFDLLAIDLRFVSVGTPDDRVLVDWQVLNNASTSNFDIKKRVTGSINWSNTATVNGTTSQFLDQGLNTDLNAFDYQISALNGCGNTILSEIHTTILLSGVQDESLNANLIFLDYDGWENGVSVYDLFLEDNANPLNLTQPNVLSNTTLVSIHDPKQYKKCFRIKAQENGGEFTESWSNEVCFYFLPTVYVPNAFTPNADNLNDGFGVKGIAINEFSMSIYNRWGEKIYQSNDINEKWMPTYLNQPIQAGTYMYLISYTDFENKSYRKAGTINLIR